MEIKQPCNIRLKSYGIQTAVNTHRMLKEFFMSAKKEEKELWLRRYGLPLEAAEGFLLSDHALVVNEITTAVEKGSNEETPA